MVFYSSILTFGADASVFRRLNSLFRLNLDRVWRTAIVAGAFGNCVSPIVGGELLGRSSESERDGGVSDVVLTA